MRSISSLSPTSASFLDPSCLKYLADMYDLDNDLLSMESTLANRTLKNTEMTTL